MWQRIRSYDRKKLFYVVRPCRLSKSLWRGSAKPANLQAWAKATYSP